MDHKVGKELRGQMEELKKNLILARHAIQYVDSCMKYGASNDPYDIFIKGGLQSMVPKMFSPIAGYTKKVAEQIVRVPRMRLHRITTLKQFALKAIKNGCGNCGEQAAIAFVFLQERNIRPLDYMVRTNADHAFVVIGRLKDSKAESPDSWNLAAVVCDPWAGSHGKVYRGNEIYLRMKGIVSPYSNFRVD